MNPSPPRGANEQQLLRHARREALLIMIVWAVSLVGSVAVSYFLGYHPEAASVRPIFGMPVWVFWGVAVPWVLCFLFSIWFCFFYMADDDLGRDRAGDADHA